VIFVTVPRFPGGLGHLSSLSVGLRSMEGRHRAPIHTEGECIYEGESLSEAECTFESVKSQSRESDKMVTIFRDSEIVKQGYCHFEP
jgi:hypothetical protein